MDNRLGVLFNPDLPTEVSYEILDRCAYRGLTILARLNKAWYYYMTAYTVTRLQRGIRREIDAYGNRELRGRYFSVTFMPTEHPVLHNVGGFMVQGQEEMAYQWVLDYIPSADMDTGKGSQSCLLTDCSSEAGPQWHTNNDSAIPLEVGIGQMRVMKDFHFILQKFKREVIQNKDGNVVPSRASLNLSWFLTRRPASDITLPKRARQVIAKNYQGTIVGFTICDRPNHVSHIQVYYIDDFDEFCDELLRLAYLTAIVANTAEDTVLPREEE